MNLSISHYYQHHTINDLSIINKKYVELNKLGFDNVNIIY